MLTLSSSRMMERSFKTMLRVSACLVGLLCDEYLKGE